MKIKTRKSKYKKGIRLQCYGNFKLKKSLNWKIICGPQKNDSSGRGLKTTGLEEKAFRLCQESNLDRPARSQTLCWLSYPAH
jgi:hypothetical protein